jgi:CrcB protein
MVIKLILIAFGGGVGAVLRYLVSGWGHALVAGTFPLGTILVNVLGCLLIGFLGVLFGGPSIIRDEFRLAITIGVLGGFTTFSTFGWETFAMINDGQRFAAASNIVLSNVLGLGAVWLGYRLAQQWQGV